MDPTIFSIGPFTLHWYGVFIVGGAVLTAWIASLYAKRAGDNPDHIWNILAVALIVGIIGARLYHVFSSPADGLGWSYYRENPLDIIAFWNGGFQGLGIYGGLLGGTLGILAYCWFNKLNPLRWLDYVAPNVLVAQAVGRMGNFVNQELYGPPTNAAWAFHINPKYPCMLPDQLPDPTWICGQPGLPQEALNWYAGFGFHPTFFYEAGMNLIAWVLLTLLIRFAGQRLRRGDGVWLYLIAYPAVRFITEMFRPDAWVIGTLPTAQWISLGAIVFAVIMLIVRHVGWDWRANRDESLAHMAAGYEAPVTPPSEQPA